MKKRSITFNDSQSSFKRLRSIIAERTNRLVIWIGAGLSIPAGMPSWHGLRDKLCSILVDNSALQDPQDLDNVKKRAKHIAELNDFWLAFSMLKDALGPATYRASIRTSLQAAETCKIPDVYMSILKLPVTGILNLNLDRLATRAFTGANPGKYLVEFSGFEARHHSHVLKESTPFIVNLHGTVADESSWVFARDELHALLRHEGYSAFIRSCLMSRTVLFVGISADDVAAGGQLEALSAEGIDLGDHFWITDRIDSSTRHWAENTQLQLIQYRNDDGDHSELRQALDGLVKYKPTDETAAPVTMACVREDVELPSPEDLQNVTEPDALREILNAQAVNLLKPVPG